MKVKTNVQGLKTPCAKVNELLNFQNHLILYILEGNKFALLWGEAQLCLPHVCL